MDPQSPFEQILDNPPEEKSRYFRKGIYLPESWGTLPDSADRNEELEWVHQQRILIVCQKKVGKETITKIKWENATRPAPSNGAIGFMLDYVADPQWFARTFLRPKASAEEDKGEEEAVVEAEVMEEEIEGMLVKLRLRAAELKAKENESEK